MRPVPIPAAAITALLSGATGGMTPALAIISDGDRRVLQVGPWTASPIPSPAAVSYVGPSGLTSDLAQAVDLRGPATISTLTSSENQGAALTLDPVSGDVFQVTGK